MRRGVTLAEVLIALGVATIAILTLALFVSLLYRTTSESKVQAAASTLARKTLERLRSEPDFFNQVLSTGTYSVDEVQAVDEKSPTNFTTSLGMTPITGNHRYYDVVVKVDWEQEHRARQIDLETYLPAP